jgi:class 3 adenylate cyclase
VPRSPCGNRRALTPGPNGGNRKLDAVPRVTRKRFEEPDEVVTLPLAREEVVVLGEVHIGRTTHEPGWSWAEHVRPVAGTPSCLYHHQGFVVSGRMQIETDDGAVRVLAPGDVFDVQPGHAARVVGDEPCVTIDFAGVRGWGKPPESGERIVATLVVTDIVESTATAVRLGDARWKTLLGGHSDRVRVELDRFRGLEVDTTGDGFLAMFDGASRAVRCAAAIAAVAEHDRLRVRAGVHSGEVEREGRTLRGVAVHAATRIASLARPGEVLVSDAAVALLEGSSLKLDDAGKHDLRGLPGRRHLYRLAER